MAHTGARRACSNPPDCRQASGLERRIRQPGRETRRTGRRREAFYILHKLLAGMNPVEAMELLLKQLGKPRTNAESRSRITLT